MNIANYTELRNRVSALIDGEDTGSSTINVATLDVFIELGESRVINGDGQTAGLRASSMWNEVTLTPTAGKVAIPDDVFEMAEVVIGGRKQELTSPWLNMRETWQQGDSIVAKDAITFRYFAQPGSLKSGLHPTFRRYPELYLYAALVEGSLFLGLPQAQVWEARYRQLHEAANRRERWRVYAGSPLRIRAS